MGAGKNQMSKNYSQQFPLKEELTDRQLGSILGVLRELQPYLLEDVVEPGGTPKDRSLDGGVESAAATSFLKACARMDLILDDASRWTLKTQNTLIAEMIRTHKAQQKFIATQEAASAHLQTPRFLLRPTLAIANEGYIAFWGNINAAGEAIIGKGKTPNEALEDFDAAFHRTPEEQIYLVAEKSGVKLDKPKE